MTFSHSPRLRLWCLGFLILLAGLRLHGREGSPTGLKSRVVDELTHDTLTEFDFAGRPIKVSGPLLDGTRANSKTFYDRAGNVTRTIDPMNGCTDITYDARNRKVRVQGPEVPDAVSGGMKRPLTDTAYDAVGNVTSITDSRNYVTTMEYDAANRPTRVVAPAVPVEGQQELVNPVTDTHYDPAGNVLRVDKLAKVGNTVLPASQTTINTYDALNRLGTTTQVLGQGADIVVSNEYDAVGNLSAVVDGKQQRTVFTYDGLKRNLTVSHNITADHPQGDTTHFYYNGLNKTSRTDADGKETFYDYDVRNRLWKVHYANPGGEEVRSYDYDDAGRLLSVTEPSKGGKADVTYEYDTMGRVTKETSGGVTHQYGYDLSGNRTWTIYGGTGMRLDSEYDALNRLKKVTEGGRETKYQYDVAGNVLHKLLPNGDRVDTDYDALGRSVTITGVSTAPGRDDVPLYHYVQARDALGNVMAIAEQTANLPARFVQMGYDGATRLVGESELVDGVVKATSYAYDKANNRATRTVQDASGTHTSNYSYDAGNRLTGLTETNVPGASREVSYGYNLAGSRVSRAVNGTIDAQYGYDGEQRLVTLAQQGHTYAYTYDYRTRRVERTEDSVATKVIFSGGTSVQERENSAPANAPTVEYVRGSDWGGGVGGILYTFRAGTPSFTHYDGRGDVTAKTNGSGTVTYQASYEAFGQRAQEQGATTDRQKANTKEEDPSGLLNEGMRYRDLETGTFTTADPAGFVDGPNLYAYVVQNPWTKFDPEGLQEEKLELRVRARTELPDEDLSRNEELERRSEQWREATIPREEILRRAESFERWDRAEAEARKEVEREDGKQAPSWWQRNPLDPMAPTDRELQAQQARIIGRALDKLVPRPEAGSAQVVVWKNGWRTLNGRFISPLDAERAGAAGEKTVWDVIRQKLGWNVIEGRVSVRNAAGNLRVYDGAAVSPRGRAIGLEVKSGGASRTGAQSAFDAGVNTVNPAIGVGQNANLEIGRSLLINVP